MERFCFGDIMWVCYILYIYGCGDLYVKYHEINNQIQLNIDIVRLRLYICGELINLFLNIYGII